MLDFPIFRRVSIRTALALVVVTWATALVASPSARAVESSADVAEAVASGPSFTKKPRWEFGVGGGYVAGQDYPASDDPNSRSLALPFFIYRSAVFRVGGGGVRAVAIERPRVRLDLSVGGSLNASSEDNGSRAGMPDLDFLFELGPQLEVSLIDRPAASGGRVQLGFAAEVRAVAATDFRGVGAQGFVAEVGLDAARRRVLGSRLDLLAGIALTFADERLQDYFYEVDAAFVTPARAEYDAAGGYLGTELTLGVALRALSNLRIFAGAQTGLYAGAANEDSPLFETTSSTGVALGLVWTIARSERLIDVVEVD